MAASVWFFFWLASLGALQVFALSIRLLANLMLFLRRPKDLCRTYGAWAVVTGPTSGIGRAMSLELARSGLNLVLVGRDPVRLRDISEAISRTYAMHTKTLLFDFSLVSTTQGNEAMSRLREAVAGLNVGVLVNNAGVVKPGAVYLHEVDVEAWVRMIRVNVLALTEVTAEVLPGMVRRGRGAVVNIGSASGSVLPSHPLYSVYVATKRYVAEFSRNLSVEYQSSCIDVQCQIPFLVETNMVSSVVKNSFFVRPWVLSPEAYARAAVQWIGHGTLCVPNFAHRLQWWFTCLFPDSFKDMNLLKRNQQHRAIFRRIKPRANSRDGRVPMSDKIGVGVPSNQGHSDFRVHS